jgi:beta-lactamase superfamily II metal-dependent hydrolase
MIVPNTAYNGIEVDMLSLGDADSILVTRWENGVASRVLIDGGNRGDTPKVKRFLYAHGAMYLDHIVCTHPHADHAGGLLDLVRDKRFDFGQFWMHLPHYHVDVPSLFETFNRSRATRTTRIIRESLETSRVLAEAVWRRKQYIHEPFEGRKIGFLTVCGPTEDFYNAMVTSFGDMDTLTTFEQQLINEEEASRLETILEFWEEPGTDHTSLADAPTEPENDSSVILGAIFEGKVFLFTGDAGVPALTAAASNYPRLENCHWMQIPHHGSHRNISEDLIGHFAPEIAFVSAVGNRKHPRRKVVSAFKSVGSKVYSTHHPVAEPLWYHVGQVPARATYGPAYSLYSTP